MARLIKAVCPRCGAGLKLDPALDYATCEYCGTSSFIKKPTRIQAAPPPPEHAHLPIIDITADLARRARAIVSVVMTVIVAAVGLTIAIGAGLFSALGGTGSSFKLPEKLMQGAFPPIVIGGPMLGDIDGDGSPEPLALTQTSGPEGSVRHLTALDPATGKARWTSDPIGDSGESFVIGVVGRRGLVGKLSTLLGYDLSSGKLAFQQALPERADRFCDDGEGALVVLKDDNVYSVDASNGKLTVRGKLRKDTRPPYRRSELSRFSPAARKRFERAIVEWETQRAQEVPCFPASSDGWRSHGVGVEETRALDPEVAGMSVSKVLRERGQGPYIALGSKQPGTRVPMLAVLGADERLLWKAELPSHDATGAREGEPGAVALGQGRIVALYEHESEKKAVMVLFEEATGRRVWEVSRPTTSLSTSSLGLTASQVFFKEGWSLHAYALVDGSELWKYGKER